MPFFLVFSIVSSRVFFHVIFTSWSAVNLYSSFVQKIEERFGRSLGSEEAATVRQMVYIYEQYEILYALDEATRKDKKTVGYMLGILENRNGKL